MALSKVLWLSIVILVVCVAVKTTTAQIQPANSRSRYGEFCNTTSKCYKGAWLTCRDGVCDCARPEEMSYDDTKQKCVSRAGERCRFELSSDSSLNEQTDCVENGKCGPDGICSCDKFFYETLNGNCLPQAGHGKTCVSDESCRVDKFLECIEGVCSCNQTKSEYSEQNGHCVGLAGKYCMNAACTPNSKCVQDIVCMCSPLDEYYQNSEGHCEKKKNFGDACVANQECLTKDIFLSCVEGICTCDPKKSKYELTNYIFKETYEENVREYSSYHHRYIQKTETRVRDVVKERHECVGLADSPCNLNQKCVTNSICTNSKCECNNGYSQTTKGVCGFDYGSICDNDRVCSDNFICSEGKCSCKDHFHQIHSPKTSITPSKCVGIVSARCANQTDCIPNTICKFNEITEGGGTGRCECDGTAHPKFVENGEGRCELAHGSACEYKSTATAKTCDKLAQLECRNELCVCPEESMVFDEERRQCFQLVGARCSETSPCVPSAICIRKRLGLSGVCECPDGTQETLAGRCEEIIIPEIQEEIIESEVPEEIREVNNNDSTTTYKTETGPVLGLMSNLTASSEIDSENMVEE